MASNQIAKTIFFGAGNIAQKAKTVGTGRLLIKMTTDPEKNESYIEAQPRPTDREGRVIQPPPDASSKACVLCRLNLPKLHYTDVMILSQFLEEDGSLLTYHETKLCSRQYILVKNLVKQAQRCNLLQRPDDYLVPGPWHDLNTYLEPDRQRDQPMKVIKKEYWRI